ncbi:hypothetical protein QBC33DRAFT_201795 [Phialemonium atrogriseum]|uniref:Uncharacterized protein n=1 Tax=Phialemonium atrogriseum TaxID=1093897 RepID=A0AAJ0FJB2_9PEZI|nr:uncharacterized protein QBC33DRAFT_201795 [Phialemonium atrogriseum]KAK1764219.1 hypothetical protein QBC33DRAFT_201795 [Phialemonium atrogriseum]
MRQFRAMGTTTSLSTAVPVLPLEITEEILSALVDVFDDDPAYQWTTLRQLSPHQKHRIERRFRDFWLRHVSLTLYYESTSDNTDFNFDGVSEKPGSPEMASFVFQGWRSIARPERNTPELLKRYWANYTSRNRNATIRLGEGVLNGGFAGGYILNDTYLSGLEIDDSGQTVRIRWKEAINELMREEMFLRRITPSLLDNFLQHYLLSDDQSNSQPASLKLQLRVLAMEVQAARRVEGLLHRLRKEDPSGNTKPHFGRKSARLHKQPVPHDYDDSQGDQRYSRRPHPDIFEVCSQEESMIPQLPIFQDWLDGGVEDEVMYDLLGEQFGWRCCQVHRRPDDVRFQQYLTHVWKAAWDFPRFSMLPWSVPSDWTAGETPSKQLDREFVAGHLRKTGYRWSVIH